ncbi:MAG: hypothetical protein IKE30_03400 [Clostridia bacterium]|nr:hypothetical protein [Clostridia bacterium]
MRSVWACARHSLLRVGSTPRVWAVLILTWLYLANLADPVKALLADMNLRASVPGFAGLLLADSQVTLLLGAGFLLILFDAPFADEMHLLLIVRAGRRRWAAGQLMYIAAAAAVYLVFALLVLALAFGPAGQYSEDWSEGIRQFTEEGAWEEYDTMIDYDPWILRAYTPWTACLLGALLHVLGYAALGCLLFCVNLAFPGRAGFFAGCLPLLFDAWIVEYLPEAWYWFSPVSLTRLTALDYGDAMDRPTLAWAFAALLALCAALGTLSLFIARVREPQEVTPK